MDNLTDMVRLKLQLMVFIVSIVYSMLYLFKKKDYIWFVLFFIIAVAYNPIVPVITTKAGWFLAGLLSGGLFLVSLMVPIFGTLKTSDIDPGLDLVYSLRLNEAFKYYNNGLKKKLKYSHTVYNNLGVISFLQNNYDKALEYFEKAMIENPEYVYAQMNFALTCQYLGNKTLFEKYLKQSISLDKGLMKVYYILAEAQVKKGTPDELTFYSTMSKDNNFSDIVIVDPEIMPVIKTFYKEITGKQKVY